jgi:DNA-binding CsgD family transcriptional regulator/uncharacterized protein YciI
MRALIRAAYHNAMSIYVVIREFRSALGSHRLHETHKSHWRQEADTGSLVGYKPTTGVGDTIIVRTQSLQDLHQLLQADPYSVTGLVTRTQIMEVEEVTAAGAGKRRDPAEGGAGRAQFLTAHERRIALLVVNGMTNSQIADQMRVSRRAIEQHITRIYRKLSITRRAQLAAALDRHYRPEESPLRSGTAVRFGADELYRRQPAA